MQNINFHVHFHNLTKASIKCGSSIQSKLYNQIYVKCYKRIKKTPDYWYLKCFYKVEVLSCNHSEVQN
jgi:hypothetical protein